MSKDHSENVTYNHKTGIATCSICHMIFNFNIFRSTGGDSTAKHNFFISDIEGIDLGVTAETHDDLEVFKKFFDE